eukprot:487293_1
MKRIQDILEHYSTKDPQYPYWCVPKLPKNTKIKYKRKEYRALAECECKFAEEGCPLKVNASFYEYPELVNRNIIGVELVYRNGPSIHPIGSIQQSTGRADYSDLQQFYPSVMHDLMIVINLNLMMQIYYYYYYLY